MNFDPLFFKTNEGCYLGQKDTTVSKEKIILPRVGIEFDRKTLLGSLRCITLRRNISSTNSLIPRDDLEETDEGVSKCPRRGSGLGDESQSKKRHVIDWFTTSTSGEGRKDQAPALFSLGLGSVRKTNQIEKVNAFKALTRQVT